MDFCVILNNNLKIEQAKYNSANIKYQEAVGLGNVDEAARQKGIRDASLKQIERIQLSIDSLTNIVDDDFNVNEDDPEYPEALRLINFLRNFLPIPSDDVPADSVLREFIGGSCFKD